MNFRALSVGVVLGLCFALLAPSCGRVSPCGPGTCSGCCTSAGLCLETSSQKDNSCGLGGLSCLDCAGLNQLCESGRCVGGSGGGSATCQATCGGCCASQAATSQCITNPSSTNCGIKGSVCKSCPPGDVCRAGNCGPADAGFLSQVGADCSTDFSCANLMCRRNTSSGSATYPGGYCTTTCVTDGDCGPTGLCVGKELATYGESDKFCLKRCTDANQCRNGYNCYSLGAQGNACWLAALPPRDAGPPANKVGIGCSKNPECTNPPEDGFCIPETTADGGSSGFMGGYCTAECDDSAHCSADGGAICVTFEDNLNACLQACASPGAGQSSCRAGYVCLTLTNSDGGASPRGICGPTCDLTGCDVGQICLANGYCK